MTAFIPSTVSAPSSTRAPVGSVTTMSFPISIRAISVVIVTALGALSSDAPATGVVETRVFANADCGFRKSVPTISAIAVIRFIAAISSCAHQSRGFAPIVSLL